MKNLRILFAILFFFPGAINSINSQTADEFGIRRKEVTKKMEPGSVLILRTPILSGRFDYSSIGGYFYYLTGIDEPDCTLILFSDYFPNKNTIAPGSKEIFFIRPINSDRINWDALTIGIEGAKSKYGIEDARPASAAYEFIGRLLASNISCIYMEVEKSSSVNSLLTEDEQLLKRARDHGATFNLMSPSVILNPMVSQKSYSEIDMMKHVINITAEAQREAMKSLKAGMYEYQLDAIIRYVFSVNGSGSVAFPSIIGSGINSVILHWMENSRIMKEGDIVVVDCGAEKNMYTADITRTMPVSGKFSDRQKAIYGIVLKANEEAIKKVAPGVKMAEVSHIADSVLADGMVRIGLIDDKTDFKKYYYHGLSHQIGLKNAYGGLVQELEPGMIITIEPGIYVREEEIGVRIEDDILVTSSGYEVLSKNAPKQIQEIENLMKQEGMDISNSLVK